MNTTTAAVGATLRHLDLQLAADHPLDAVAADATWPPGKLIRPMLTAAGAALVGGDPSQVETAGLAMELLHTATLTHDDVIDGDRRRRHRASVWAAHDVPTALLAGDLLIFRTFDALLASPVSPTRALVAARLVAQCGAELCRGEADEAALVGRPDVPLREYLAVCARKTGALLGTSCAVGAVVGGGDAGQVRLLGSIGYLIGYVYQMRDDLLPYVSDAASMGKDITSDARQRRATLPVIVAWNRSDAQGRRHLRDLLAPSGRDEHARHRDLVDFVTTSGALVSSRRMVVAGGRRAIDLLEQVPASTPRHEVQALVEKLAGAADLRAA